VNAVVFGNGESRKSINPSSLKSTNILIGCNAIHRDAVMDHLVCCDRRMVEEAVENPNTANTTIYAREDWFKYYRKIQKRKNIHLVPDVPYRGELKADQAINWGSGPYAVLVAANLDVDNIKLIGFDLYSSNDKVNNLYKGSSNYSKPDSQAVDYSFWIYQISKIFSSFPTKQFSIYNKKDWELPSTWRQANVNFITLDNLKVDL
jgi:hypothetical protein